MSLQLSHQKLDVCACTQVFALEYYKLTRTLPSEEKFAMAQQIRRAARSVHLNLAEGCSRKSKAERSRFFEISRGSLIEIDACLDLAVNLNYATFEGMKAPGDAMIKTFQMLNKMI